MENSSSVCKQKKVENLLFHYFLNLLFILFCSCYIYFCLFWSKTWKCKYSLHKFQVIIRSMGKKQTGTGPFQKVKGIPQRPQTQKWPLRARKRKRSQVRYLIWNLRIEKRSEINETFTLIHVTIGSNLFWNPNFLCKSTHVLSWL